MTPERLVLDSDIVIHLLKKQAQTVACFISLLEKQTVFLLSPIVVAEIYAGAFEREHQEIETLFSLCQRIVIENRLALLYSDRDFDPFVEHLGLQSALHPS